MTDSLKEYIEDVRSWDSIYAFDPEYTVYKVFIGAIRLNYNPPYIVVITRGDKDYFVIRRQWCITIDTNKPQMFRTKMAAEEAAILRKLVDPYGC